MGRVWGSVVKIVGAVFAVIALLASVSPEEAHSRLFGWFHLFGIDRAPSIFAGPNADLWVRTFALIGVGIVSAILAYNRWLRGKPVVPFIGMVVSVSALIICAVWFYVAPSESSVPYSEKPANKIAPKNPIVPEMPTIPTLFMTDFQGKGSGGGIIVTLNGVSEITFNDKTELTTFYNLIEDFGNQSKFLILYVPPSARTFEAIIYLAQNYKGCLEGPHMASGTVGISSEVDSSRLVFTGRIFVYYESALTLSQLGQLDQAFRDNGASAEFRSTSYAAQIWDSVRQGRIKEPLRYEVHGNRLQLAPVEKKQP